MTRAATRDRAVRSGLAVAALTAAALASAALASAGAAGATEREATAAQTAGRGAITISLDGATGSTLRAGDVRLRASGGARANGRRIVLPVARSTSARGVTQLVHRGRVVLRSPDGTVRLASFRTRVGASSAAVSAQLGRGRVTLFSIRTGRGAVDLADGRVRAARATVRLTGPGARALTRGLGVRGLRAGVVGRAGVTARITPAPQPAPAPPAPAPAPQPQPQPPAPQPVAPQPPAPQPPQPQLCPAAAPAPTPVTGIGETVWSAKRSWIDYVLRHWPGPGPAGSGCVLATDGASQVDPADRYGWQWTATSLAPDAATGELRLTHAGTLEFRAPAHYIAIKLSDPTFVVSADRTRAAVIADGQASGSMEDAMAGAAKPEPFTDLHVLDLDLSQATVEVDGDVATYRGAPATIAAAAAAALSYPAGSDYGSFTFALPAQEPPSAPGVRWRLRKSFVDYMLRQWPSINPDAPNELFGRVHAAGGAAVGTAADQAAPPASSVVSEISSVNRSTGAKARASEPFVSSPDFDYLLDLAEGTAPRYQAELPAPAVLAGDGGETIVQLGGQVGFQMPAHFIDIEFDAPRIVIAPDLQSADVVSDGHDGGSMECALDPECDPELRQWDDLHVLDLDLAAVTPTSGTDDDGTPLTIWTDVPATISADGAGSLNYGAGDPYGRFTIAVPTEVLPAG